MRSPGTTLANRLIAGGVVVIGLAGLIRFSLAAEADTSKYLVIYSGRKEPLIKPVVELFEQETGIQVIVKSGKSAILGQQILQELPRPGADVYVANDAAALEFLRLRGALEPHESEATRRIPEAYRAKDGSWLGVSGRARAILYNTELVREDELPQSVSDLTDPVWKGRIAATNGGNESLAAWVSAMRLVAGTEPTRTLLQGLKANQIALLSDSHTDVRKAVGRGEFALGLINHYYYHLQRHDEDPVLRSVGIIYPDQEEGGIGTQINVAGAAIVRGGPNPDAARAFLDFLVSPRAQRLFAEVNFEYPLLPDVEAMEEVRESLGCEDPSIMRCLRVMAVRLDQLGEAMDETHALLEDVNWFE